jgi:hypothetical protein
LVLADLAGESQLEPGTRLDEGVMLVERRVAQPHVVHGTLPGLESGLIRTIATGPRRMFPCRSKFEVVDHAATQPVVRGGQDIPDAIIPFAHPGIVFGCTRGRLHPFCGNTWEVRKIIELEVVRGRGRGQMGRR